VAGSERRPLRVLLHDFGGYAFIAELARELARRGHDVHHVHYASLRRGKGSLRRQDDDPPSLSFGAIDLGRELDRYRPTDRLRLERAYARALGRTAAAWQPDVVLSADTPLLVLHWLRPQLNRAGVPLVNWLQDLHSIAMGGDLVRRMGRAGRLGAAGLERVEARLLRSCAAVVAVTPDFVPVLSRWRVPADRVRVVPNWAELFPIPPRRNGFSAAHGLDDRTVLLYAGTLGLKHDPLHLVLLAEAFRNQPDVAVVVVSEGLGRDWLESERRARRLSNLVLVDFQPAERVPEVLATADVLLSMIRPEAGRFSVPSKVLTYLAAGRAQLSALPAYNLAARVLRESGAAVLVDPERPDDWVRGARALVADPDRRAALGRDGRAYADAHFDLQSSATTFEDVLFGARARAGAGAGDGARAGRRGRARR